MQYSVRALKLGEMPVPGPEVYWMSHWEEFENLFWLMIVARNEKYTVLINCGPPPDLTDLNALWKRFHPSGRVQFKREKSEEPANALASIGVRPEEVTHLILTPLVAYTCGSLPLFINAQYVISRRGWIEDVFAPPIPVHVPRDIFLPPDVMKYLLFDANDRLRLMDEGEVCPGISVWWAGVHHRSSLAVVIQSHKGRVIVSDAFFKYGNIENNHYLGVGESYTEAMHTYDRVRRDANIIIPLYEREVFDRFPGGKIA